MMKMKKLRGLFIYLCFPIFLPCLLVGKPRKDDLEFSGDVRVINCIESKKNILKVEGGNNNNRTSILVVEGYIKNISRNSITVLTKNDTIMFFENDMFSMRMSFYRQSTVEEELIKPSIYRFYPVTLKPGEVTELLYYNGKVKSAEDITDTVQLQYQVGKDLGKLLKVWHGELNCKINRGSKN